MNVAFSTVPSNMIAYWRLDEKNDGTYTAFTDSVSLLTFDPTPVLLTSVVEMREIYLKICPESFYP